MKIKWRGAFGLNTNSDAMLAIYGDGAKDKLAYLGPDGANNEMMLQLESKSKNDQRQVTMWIDEKGFDFEYTEVYPRTPVGTT